MAAELPGAAEDEPKSSFEGAETCGELRFVAGAVRFIVAGFWLGADVTVTVVGAVVVVVVTGVEVMVVVIVVVEGVVVTVVFAGPTVEVAVALVEGIVAVAVTGATGAGETVAVSVADFGQLDIAHPCCFMQSQ